MSGFDLFKLSFLLGLLSNLQWSFAAITAPVHKFSSTCSHIECPAYQFVHAGEDYEIRRYNSTVWMSTSSLQDISLVKATRFGFLQLFSYIQGKNARKEQIEMTAPVITEVLPSDGPLCASSFVVSFYVPKLNQKDPPKAEGLDAHNWDTTYIAVRRFGGFVSDFEVGKEAAALQASLNGSAWSHNVVGSVYTVAQYNSPFEFKDRVNEIWMKVHAKDTFSA